MRLITFSGMVGSGKTTNAKNTLRLLRALGYQPHYLRFRFLNWSSLFRSPAVRPWQEPKCRPKPANGTYRRSPQSPRPLAVRRPLTLARALGFWLRAIRVRLFLFLHHRRHVVVLNRYFYDSFAHFRLASQRELKYLRWLMSVVPQPDLPILLELQPETAQRRRPAYAFDDLEHLAENTLKLRRHAKHLVAIATDDPATIDQQIAHHVRRVFARTSSVAEDPAEKSSTKERASL